MSTTTNSNSNNNSNKPKQTLKEDLIIRGIKIIDIGYITILYFILGFLVSITYMVIRCNCLYCKKYY